MENMIRDVFKETINVDLPDPYPVMSWHEAMTRFGSDKPDLRIKGIELREITVPFRHRVARRQGCGHERASRCQHAAL